MWSTYALLSALFAGATAVLAKAGVSGIPSNLAMLVRTAVVLVLAAALVLARGETAGLNTLSSRNWIFLVLSGCATGLSWLFYYRALQLGTVAQVAAVDKLSVAIAIGLSVVFLGEVLTLKVALGAGLVVLGTLVLVW